VRSMYETWQPASSACNSDNKQIQWQIAVQSAMRHTHAICIAEE